VLGCHHRVLLLSPVVIVVDGGGVELVEDEDDVEPLFSSILLPALIGLVDEGPHSVAIH
jgi:hypothetical protein